MSTHTVCLIPGDGIGPEITTSLREVIAAAGVQIDWNVVEAGAGVMDEYGTPLPDHVLDAIASAKVAIKGPVTTPVGSGFRSINVALRKHFDLYTNLRPARSIAGTGARYDDVDIVLFRENTEDLYAGVEVEEGSAEAAELIDWAASHDLGTIRPDSAISLKPISVTASERIVRAAFDYAVANGRHKVCAVHKANIMKYTDGLFLHTAERVAQDYAGQIEFETRIVDATCMGLVTDPSDFDVMVMPNLYGDIVSDLCAGLVGGLGMAPGANIGDEIAVFEAVHGSAPDIAGQGIANPTAEILSGCMLLDHLGEREAATRIRAAVEAVFAAGKVLTGDVKKIVSGSADGAASTQEFTQAVIAAL
ncbi:MAG: isocitrate/isopropylmalate dehydrogenase family protein [Coriobacteriaceae bacterium]|nr:isocitrate/isopropylmalate dehydrogenase family protein [Coriobacteriaceae bacterium]